MTCPVKKIDSNSTGLRIAEEACLKVLPTVLDDGFDPTWYPQEPNAYSDFGGQIVTVARDPINPSRQRKKGVITDVDASGGFNTDVTQDNLRRLMQGFMFADAREKPDTKPLNGTERLITGVTAVDDAYAAAAGLDSFKVNHLILASGFAIAANNGIKTVITVAAGEIEVAEALTDEAAPPTDAKFEAVGYEFPTGDVAISMVGSMCRLTSVIANLDTLGLIAGEWVYLGGDGVATRFANNVGFARIGAITAAYIEFDKINWTGATEAGAGKDIRIWFGKLIQNESNPALIKRRSYQLERTLGEDADGTMSEYLIGAVPNELNLNVQQADKVTADLNFVACDYEHYTGLEGVKDGTRPTLAEFDAYNTSSDFSRTKMSLVDDTSSNVTALYAFVTELTLNITNNVSPNKAISVLGAFDLTAGNFELSGSLTAYFADVTAVQAVRDNADITLDVIMVKNNAGLVFDVPLLSLGNGRLNVEKDQAITLPLDTMGAQGKFGSTLMFGMFSYLPTIAAN